MRKTDKKIDNQMRKILTDVCETALKEIAGFEWLTHLVDYSNFPKSVKVVCVFDTNANLDEYLKNNEGQSFQQYIVKALFKMDVRIALNQIVFDTEEACFAKHHGKWSDRLAL